MKTIKKNITTMTNVIYFDGICDSLLLNFKLLFCFKVVTVSIHLKIYIATCQVLFSKYNGSIHGISKNGDCPAIAAECNVVCPNKYFLQTIATPIIDSIKKIGVICHNYASRFLTQPQFFQVIFSCFFITAYYYWQSFTLTIIHST